MDFSSTVEVLIGLAVLYWLLASLCSWIVEWFFTWCRNRRGEILRLSIAHIVGDKAWVSELYEQPLIKSLFTNTTIFTFDQDRQPPAYIAPDVFSRAIVDLVIQKFPSPTDPAFAGASQFAKFKLAVDKLDITLQPMLAGVLKPIADRANRDMATVHKEIQLWFEASMDRASGWYKRHAMAWLFYLGLLIAVAANIDTIQITKALFNNPALRADALKIATATTRGGGSESAIPQQLLFVEFFNSPVCSGVKSWVSDDGEAATTLPKDEANSACLAGLSSMTLRSRSLLGVSDSIAALKTAGSNVEPELMRSKLVQFEEIVAQVVCPGRATSLSGAETEGAKPSPAQQPKTLGVSNATSPGHSTAAPSIEKKEKCESGFLSSSRAQRASVDAPNFAKIEYEFWADAALSWSPTLGGLISKCADFDTCATSTSQLRKTLKTAVTIAGANSLATRSYVKALPGVGNLCGSLQAVGIGNGRCSIESNGNSRTYLDGVKKWDAFLMLVGWLLTALAVSFGAPSWFDLMGKLVNVRGAGEKPPSLP